MTESAEVARASEAHRASFDVLDFVRSGGTLAEFTAADDDLTDAAQPTWSVRRVNAPLLWQQLRP